MRRYLGEPLQAGFSVAVLANDALGNFAVATPLLQMLRTAGAGRIDLYCGARVAELADPSQLIDRHVRLYGAPPRDVQVGDAPNLVVNLEATAGARAVAAMLCGPETAAVGPCLDAEGRGDLPFAADNRGRLAADPAWVAEGLIQRYPFLKSPWIAEVFCRLAYLDGHVPGYSLVRADPARVVPDVLLATAASLGEKLWPIERWIELASRLVDRGLTVGLVGAKPSDQGRYWQGASDEDRLVASSVEDLRGVWTLPQVVGALAAARQVVTLDNGILHLACSTATPVIGLFRHGIHRLWAPPVPNLVVLTPGEGRPVGEISVDTVMSALAPKG
jgi:heptosyltransferase III